ncbi:hypothetical protein BC936DRAFT_137358 [Jimgerdemannia flammicorona]|uniref:Uncharacterized protein n=1 Tax=Jimgerdemannia flammicorona TaxID=994334 RepID=A0A433CXK0_9FUNG|nr:hypothetical protein BC936DRAFT_137358 [Jimgerdemannia flammicorona]
MAALDDYVLQTPASEWSLSGFLEHRANKKDFTRQKDKEHFRYQRCLAAVQSSNEFNEAEKEQAEHCLKHFPAIPYPFFLDQNGFVLLPQLGRKLRAEVRASCCLWLNHHGGFALFLQQGERLRAATLKASR